MKVLISNENLKPLTKIFYPVASTNYYICKSDVQLLNIAFDSLLWFN